MRAGPIVAAVLAAAIGAGALGYPAMMRRSEPEELRFCEFAAIKKLLIADDYYRDQWIGGAARGVTGVEVDFSYQVWGGGVEHRRITCAFGRPGGITYLRALLVEIDGAPFNELALLKLNAIWSDDDKHDARRRSIVELLPFDWWRAL